MISKFAWMLSWIFLVSACDRTHSPAVTGSIDLNQVKQIRWTSPFGVAILQTRPKVASKWGEPAWILTQPSNIQDGRIDPRLWRTLLDSLNACRSDSKPGAVVQHRFELFFGSQSDPDVTPEITLTLPEGAQSARCLLATRLLGTITEADSRLKLLSDARPTFWTERDVATLTVKAFGKQLGPAPLWQNDRWKEELRSLLDATPCTTPPQRSAAQHEFVWILKDQAGEQVTLRAKIPKAAPSHRGTLILESDERPTVRFCLPEWRMRRWIDIIK